MSVRRLHGFDRAPGRVVQPRRSARARPVALVVAAVAISIAPAAFAADMTSASYTIRGAEPSSGGVGPSPSAGMGLATSAGAVGQTAGPALALSGDGQTVIASGFYAIVAGALPGLDVDLDGVASAVGLGDNCPTNANADQADFDGDLAGDVCDPDDDDDGLLDVVETNTGVFVSPGDTGTDPFNVDSDGDGFADGEEVAAGSDPNDPGSVPGPVSVPALGLVLRGLLALGFGLFGSRALIRAGRARTHDSSQRG